MRPRIRWDEKRPRPVDGGGTGEGRLAERFGVDSPRKDTHHGTPFPLRRFPRIHAAAYQASYQASGEGGVWPGPTHPGPGVPQNRGQKIGGTTDPKRVTRRTSPGTHHQAKRKGLKSCSRLYNSLSAPVYFRPTREHTCAHTLCVNQKQQNSPATPLHFSHRETVFVL